jgi:hypothetical protein
LRSLWQCVAEATERANPIENYGGRARSTSDEAPAANAPCVQCSQENQNFEEKKDDCLAKLQNLRTLPTL